MLPYVPRLVAGWLRDTPDASFRELEGSLVLVDISGFTRMSERLARKGRVGAEVLSDQISDSFAQLMAEAYDYGGGLLKFGGDALLLWFEDPGHEARACRAASGMRRVLRRIGRLETAAGSVVLRLSVGVHSDTFQFFLVGETHRELVVTGPAATHTVLMESTARAGQIVISERTAAALPRRSWGDRMGDGLLLAGQPSAPMVSVAPVGDDVDVAGAIPVAIREHLTAGGDEPDHRQVTVAFVHVGGLDRVLSTSGPEGGAAALHAVLAEVQRAAEANGVAFMGTDVAPAGTKVILAAGAPKATGDHEERMLLTLREVVDRGPAGLPLRIGVNRGAVFAGDVGPAYRRTYTVMGDPVNLSARLMQASAPGLILTVDDVLVRSRTRFRTAELEPFEVKGKAKPILAFAVGQALKEDRATRQTSDVPLVGRERETALLQDSVDAVLRGEGRVIQIIGEPGIGKSRLVQDTTKRAAGAVVISASSQPYGSSVPFFVFGQLLRSVVGLERDARPAVAAALLRSTVEAVAPDLLGWLPLLGAPLGVAIDPTPETRDLDERFRLGKLAEVSVSLLEALLASPTVLVLEDAQWMDEASADLFRSVVAAAERRPWLLLVTRRDGPAGLKLPEAPHALSFRPSHLTSEDAFALGEKLTEASPIPGHDLSALVGRSGGNPLFLEELLAARMAGLQDLPDSVEEVVSARIDRLVPSERSLLRHAAVLGTTFSRGLLVAVLGGDADAVEGTWERLDEFIEADPASDDRFRFRQSVVRDAAYEALSFRKRQELHARAGEAILRSSVDPDGQSEVLSLHFFHAGRYAEAWRFSALAGRRSGERYANAEAAAFYTRAVESARRLPDVPPTEVADIQESLGDLWDRLGESRRAEAAYRAARRSLPDDPVAQARLLLKEAGVPERVGRFSQALRSIARGHRLVESVEGEAAARQRARLSAAYASILQAQGRHLQAVRWCRRAIAEAEQSGDRDALGHAYSIISWAYASLGNDDGCRYAEEALAIYEELGDLGRQGLVLNYLGAYAYFESEWDRAAEYYQRAREARERTGDPVNAAFGMLNVGEILLDQGHLERAEDLFRSALRTWRASGYRYGVALAVCYLGRAASRAGRFDEAARMLAEARADFDDVGDRASVLETDVRIAECLLLRGDPDGANQLATDALKRAEESGGINVHAPAMHRIRGLALAMLGDLPAAREALDRSLELGRARNAAFEEALTLLALAAVGRGDGLDAATARSFEVQGRSILDRLGVVAVPLPAVPVPLAGLRD
jgi:class 3 adenylate cyclase/tetratricopeptide (TPR) repeat protein